MNDSVLHNWQASAIATERRWSRLASNPLTRNSELAAQTVRVKDIDNSAQSRRRHEMLSALGLPSDCDRAGPGAKIKALSENADDTDSIKRFRDVGVDMNTTRQTTDALSSVTVGSPCYAALGDLAREPYFAPPAERVKRWGFSDNVETFPIYVGQLAKDCRILDLHFSRKNGGAEAVIKGLWNSRYVDNPFGEFAIRDTFAKLVRQERPDAPFGPMFLCGVYFRSAHAIRGRPIAAIARGRRSIEEDTSRFQIEYSLTRCSREKRLVFKSVKRKMVAAYRF